MIFSNNFYTMLMREIGFYFNREIFSVPFIVYGNHIWWFPLFWNNIYSHHSATKHNTKRIGAVTSLRAIVESMHPTTYLSMASASQHMFHHLLCQPCCFSHCLHLTMISYSTSIQMSAEYQKCMPLSM